LAGYKSRETPSILTETRAKPPKVDQARERSEARRQAFRAAQDAADGKTREQVRDLSLAEPRARGLDEPRDALLEATVDLLTGHPLIANGRALIHFGKGCRPP